MATSQCPDEANYSTICEGLSAWLSAALREDPEVLTKEETLQAIRELHAKGDPETIELMKKALQKPGPKLNHAEVLAIEFSSEVIAKLAKVFASPF